MPEPSPGQLLAFLALRRGIRAAEDWLGWADEAEAALARFAP